ncbi:MAG TPA: GtrA family protein [Ktedonobacteraceae bacterium]|jgi:putative flippase GtrA
MLIETREAHDIQGAYHAQQQAEAPYRPPLLRIHWKKLQKQVVRFGLVGGVNTVLDLLALNALLLLFPTNQTWLILLYNVSAYSFGAFNSFLLNKYWTFQNKRSMSWGEFSRFALTTLLGMATNTTLVWVIGLFPHPFMQSTYLWTNASKVLAITVSASVSYFGMRFWVFMQKS